MTKSQKKKKWIAPKATKLSDIRHTEGKYLPTLPENTYEISPGGFTPGGS